MTRRKDLASSHTTSHDALIIAIDVGGTNTRANIAVLTGAKIAKYRESQQRIQSKEELAIFVRKILKGLEQKGSPSRCAIDFAGPLFGHKEVQMTNWSNKPKIHLEELIDWGLPENHTLMLNDMEAAAFGIIQLSEQFGIPSPSCISLFEPVNSMGTRNQLSNRILLAPGTGLGTAGIVAVKTPTGDLYWEPIPSEIQHSAVSPLDDNQGHLIQWLRGKKQIFYWPSWEDFVSGQGLIDIYEGIHAMGSSNKEVGKLSWNASEDPAALIAEHAVRQTDPICEEALHLYYRCVGRVAQLLALTYLPYGGIFLCGASTTKNAHFIRQSRFVQEVQANPTHKDLIRQFPIYLVAEELNIAGGLWACIRRIA